MYVVIGAFCIAAIALVALLRDGVLEIRRKHNEPILKQFLARKKRDKK
jgi:hypothetical protein